MNLEDATSDERRQRGREVAASSVASSWLVVSNMVHSIWMDGQFNGIPGFVPVTAVPNSSRCECKCKD